MIQWVLVVRTPQGKGTGLICSGGLTVASNQLWEPSQLMYLSRPPAPSLWKPSLNLGLFLGYREGIWWTERSISIPQHSRDNLTTVRAHKHGRWLQSCGQSECNVCQSLAVLARWPKCCRPGAWEYCWHLKSCPLSKPKLATEIFLHSVYERIFQNDFWTPDGKRPTKSSRPVVLNLPNAVDL